MDGHKALTGVSIKDADQGLVEAVFSTFGVVDHDGDVTLAGAFEDGAKVQISAYGHKSWDGALPVGKGTIRTTEDEAILVGQFFSNDYARLAFDTVKEMEDLQEWSYGFDVLESSDGEHDDQKVRVLEKLKVHEVSPVLLGAGVGTRTLSAKGKPTFAEEADRVLGDVEGLISRAGSFGSQSAEAKAGRVLSAANRERLAVLMSAMGDASGALRELLDETDPDKARLLLLGEEMRFEEWRLTQIGKD